jgi:hypothetical protein
MAVITRGNAGEDAPCKPLISLGRRLAKVGEEENPHTPYARRRRGTARRALGLRRRIGAAP